MLTQVRQWFVTKWQSKKGKAGFFGMLYGFVMWVLDAPGRWHQLGQWRTDMPTMHLHLSQLLNPGIFVAGVVLLLWDGSKKRTATALVGVRRIRHYPGKVMVNIEPDQLTKIFREHTTAQASNMVKPYIGAWLEVSGTVGNADNTSPHYNFVSVRGVLSDYGSVLCYFPKGNEMQVGVLRRDAPVMILGKLDDVDIAHITLRECEFIHEPLEEYRSLANPNEA